ncbi:sirohydrochlorin chelatase [Corynebacterium sp.]|uniref:sirohydrochlorin chelatase n=1 Tax=Corynebacterium sp. TaxID=1720 RepID=UPI0026DCB0D4|nr:CbiX/SirB N-terminal domain-containing protein [Corynebacterium sp.]MDO4610637.1 CbiX/SirB N-terminal domain-containing protein [Corynebacterium sp.]
MTALILLAHGSRHPDTAAAFERLADAVRAALPCAECGGPSQVRTAWLDLAEPSLDDVLDGLAAAGERRAVVVPMLFTDAFHARVDVPGQIRDGLRHGVDVHVAHGLGLGEGVHRAVVRSLVGAVGDRLGSSDVVVMAVGSSDAAANEAVRGFAAGLDATLPGRVSAAFAVAVDGPRGADAVALAAGAAAERGRDLAVVPLFTAPGLLWDLVTGDGREHPCTVRFAEPLAELLADVVVARWDSDPASVHDARAVA